MAKRRAKSKTSETTEAPLLPAELPEGWAVATLGDGLVVEVTPGFACGAHSRDAAGVAHLRPMNVNSDGRIDLGNVKYVPSSAAAKADKWLEKGDVLFNNTNSAELVGKTAYYDRDERLAFSNHMTRVRVRTDGLDSRYCAFYLHANWRAGDFEARCNHHVSQASIGREVLRETPIPVPPLTEQKRIANRIETLLKSVDAARERLAKVPEIVKRLRQSTLVAACSGCLTEEWRETNSNVETGETLLRRIAAERKSAIAGEKRRKTADGDEEAEEVDLQAATWDTPDTWTWCRISEVLHYQRSAAYGVLQPGGDLPDGVPFVRVCDLANGTVETRDIKRIAKKIDAQYPRTKLHGGEVLVTLVGTIGRIAVVPNDLAGANVARAVGMLPLCPHVLPEYLRIALDQPAKNTELGDLAREVARKTLNLGLLKAVSIPLPPFVEQVEIVRRVGELQKAIAAIGSSVGIAESRTARLVQASLGKAFCGELVPTEAELAAQEGRSFESGEELLRRIRDTPPPARKPRVIEVHVHDTITISDEVEMRRDREISATLLRDILRKTKAGMSPERLLDESALNVDDFYTQLKREVEAGQVRERRKDMQTIILEAKR